MSGSFLLEITEFDELAMFSGLILILFGFTIPGLIIMCLGALFYLDELEVI